MTSENPIVKEITKTADKIVVIPSYNQNREKLEMTKLEYEILFKNTLRLEFTFVMPNNGVIVENEELFEKIADADLVFFSGGSQRQLTQLLINTKTLKLIKDRFNDGNLAIAGTSAGCAALSEKIILGGFEEPEMGVGLGFLPNLIMDQHFSSGNMDTRVPRLGRLKKAVEINSGLVGVGVDENTCIVFEGKTGESKVIGEGKVTIIDEACEITLYNNNSSIVL